MSWIFLTWISLGMLPSSPVPIHSFVFPQCHTLPIFLEYKMDSSISLQQDIQGPFSRLFFPLTSVLRSLLEPVLLVGLDSQHTAHFSLCLQACS